MRTESGDFNPQTNRLLKLIPMLGSPSDGERLSATYAIERTLAAAGFTFHDLAAHIAAQTPQRRRWQVRPTLDHEFMACSLMQDTGALKYADAVFVRAIDKILNRGIALDLGQARRLKAIFDASTQEEEEET